MGKFANPYPRHCPDCEMEMDYEEGFEDCFSHITGHYTVAAPGWFTCPKCKLEIDATDFDFEIEDEERITER